MNHAQAKTGLTGQGGRTLRAAPTSRKAIATGDAEATSQACVKRLVRGEGELLGVASLT
jgi:hypothetical protein